MQWWQSASRGQTPCADARQLIDEWILKASSASAIASLQPGTGAGGRPALEDLQEHCHNEEIAEFAWMTLKVSRALFCFNASEVLPLESREDSVEGTSELAKCLLTTIFVTIFVLGFFGNLLTVIVIYSTPCLHSHTNYFLASLACSDLLLIVFGVPFDVIHLWLNETLPSIPGYCELMSTSIGLFTHVSVLTIVALTAERFLSICYPFRLRPLISSQRVLHAIYACWIIAFFPAVYIGLQFKQVTPDFCGYNRDLGDGTGNCDYVANRAIPFRFPFEVTMLITFVLPVGFIIFCYVRILLTLSEMASATTVHVDGRRVSSEPSESCVTPLYVHTKSPDQRSPTQQAQRVVILMLATVTAVFFVCYLPYHIERLIVYYTRTACDRSPLCQMLYPITGLLQYVSAALNPIFYNLMSVRFRSGFLCLIKRLFAKHGSSASISSPVEHRATNRNKPMVVRRLETW